jgi:hypothetical protein
MSASSRVSCACKATAPSWQTWYFLFGLSLFNFTLFFLCLLSGANFLSCGQCCGGTSSDCEEARVIRILVCRWYVLLLTRSVKPLALCEAWGRATSCYWSAVGCNGQATVVEVGWLRCCLEDCWECCTSLGLARWGVLFSEARWSQRVHLAGSHLSLSRPAPIAGYVATCGTCRANTRTALLELSIWTFVPCWGVPSVDAACNNHCIVAVVGYHGNPVLLLGYRFG